MRKFNLIPWADTHKFSARERQAIRNACLLLYFVVEDHKQDCECIACACWAYLYTFTTDPKVMKSIHHKSRKLHPAKGGKLYIIKRKSSHVVGGPLPEGT